MKELIVILAIAGVAFRLAKPIALRFSDLADFQRRRNVWFALTIIAFLSPNFWFFAVVAIPIYVWAGGKDSNPVAAYVLFMHVVPPVPIDIPVVGIGQLFEVDNYRLLAFCILVPTALHARRAIVRNQPSNSRMIDLLILGYGLVQIALFVPPDLPNHVILHDSPTNLLRRAFLFIVDVFVLYYAVSRGCNDRRRIMDAQAAFCLACGIMALVATFEQFRTWLLYKDLALQWNPTDNNYLMSWLFRDSWLRTQATAGHPLSLGFLLAVAFGFWLYLNSRIATIRARIAVGFVFWCGLIAAYSRGPWIGAVLIYLAYSALNPRAISRLFKAAFVLAILLGLASLSPMGEKLMSSLHVTGGQPDATFLYRQRLLDRSFEVIQAHPFFGDQLALQNMEDLRQGQGIIDIVNAYIGVAMFSGLVGLALFLGFIFFAMRGAFRIAKTSIAADPDWGLLGFNLLACIAGVSFMLANSSLIFGVAKMFYVLIALAAAYVRAGKQTSTAPDLARSTGRESAQKNRRASPAGQRFR